MADLTTEELGTLQIISSTSARMSFDARVIGKLKSLRLIVETPLELGLTESGRNLLRTGRS